MADLDDLYIVRPDIRGGWQLTGPPGMKNALWFDLVEDAEIYARLRINGTGGRIMVLERDGATVRSETVEGV